MQFNTLASNEVVQDTISNLSQHGFRAEVVKTGADALERLKALIPASASIHNGTSKTLQQIGFIDYLKGGQHGWNNLHEAVVKESDPVKQAALRQQAIHADYFVVSAHALSQTGEIVVANATGSSMPSITYTSKNVVFVVSTKKIAPTLDGAISRLKEHVFPQENQRMVDAGYGASVMSQILIFGSMPEFMGRSIHVIFVEEDLGF